MIDLRRESALSVLNACLVPVSLITDADGTSQRESYRRFVMGAVEPLSQRMAEELSRKLDIPSARLPLPLPLGVGSCGQDSGIPEVGAIWNGDPRGGCCFRDHGGMSRILNPAIFKSGRTKLMEALQKERNIRKAAEKEVKALKGEIRRIRAAYGDPGRISPESRPLQPIRRTKSRHM